MVLTRLPNNYGRHSRLVTRPKPPPQAVQKSRNTRIIHKDHVGDATENNDNHNPSPTPTSSSTDDFQLQQIMILDRDESAVRFVPRLTPKVSNPCQCCNIQLHKIIQFFGLLFIVMRTLIITAFLYIALNPETFLVMFHYEKRNGKAKAVTIKKVQTASSLLLIREVIYIISTFFLLLIGARYRKYDFLKCWVVFTSLHETLALIALALSISFFLKVPSLCFHLPISLPFTIFLIWLTLRLMKQIKEEQIIRREQGPELIPKKPGNKAKNLYPPEIMPVDFEKDVNANE